MQHACYATLIFLNFLKVTISVTQPNIVVILADDLGYNDVSFQSSIIPTPNIDALAYGGTILQRHYVLPSCTPSRSAFLTGLHPIRLGTQGYPLRAGQPGGIPLEYKLLPQYLRELGYKTHMVGKWHVGYATKEHLPTERGFDTFLGYYNGFVDYYQFDYNQTLTGGQIFYGYDGHDENGVRRDLEGVYATEVFTEAATNIIKNHNKNEPLFLYLSHLAAHTGTEVEGDGLQPPPNVDVNETFPYMSTMERRHYASIVTALDDSVGQIVSSLSESGLLNNTIIFFLSDNGAPSVAVDTPPNYGSNWPLRGVKFTLYEGGVRGVAVIWSPLLPRGHVYEQAIHITDWLPTFVSAANGMAKPVDGVDVWSDLKAGFSSDDRDILLNIDEKQNTEAVLLSGRWKIVKQNMMSYGNCDFHYDAEHLNSSNDDLESIKNSLAGKAILDNSIKDAYNNLMKRSTKCIPNDLHKMGWVDPSKDFLCQNYCVFDVIDDPCELSTIDRPDLKIRGKALLDKWRNNVVPQNDQRVDELSNPINFGGVWSPWLQSHNKILGENDANMITTTTLMLIIIIGILIKIY